jgi:hypothetical protein
MLWKRRRKDAKLPESVRNQPRHVEKKFHGVYTLLMPPMLPARESVLSDIDRACGTWF